MRGKVTVIICLYKLKELCQFIEIQTVGTATKLSET